jgi:hypothetical protein
MDAIEEIKQLYFNATAKTIQRDLARAIDLLKTLPDEESRERVAVYMDGLAQMRSEWGGRGEPHDAGRRPGPGNAGNAGNRPKTGKPAKAGPPKTPPKNGAPGGTRD